MKGESCHERLNDRPVLDSHLSQAIHGSELHCLESHVRRAARNKERRLTVSHHWVYHYRHQNQRADTKLMSMYYITYVVLDSRLIKSSMHQCIKAKNIHYRILDGSMIRSRAIHTCRIAIRTSRDRQFLIKTTSNDTTDTCRSCIGNAKARPVKRQEQDNIFHKYNE